MAKPSGQRLTLAPPVRPLRKAVVKHLKKQPLKTLGVTALIAVLTACGAGVKTPPSYPKPTSAVPGDPCNAPRVDDPHGSKRYNAEMNFSPSDSKYSLKYYIGVPGHQSPTPEDGSIFIDPTALPNPQSKKDATFSWTYLKGKPVGGLALYSTGMAVALEPKTASVNITKNEQLVLLHVCVDH